MNRMSIAGEPDIGTLEILCEDCRAIFQAPKGSARFRCPKCKGTIAPPKLILRTQRALRKRISNEMRGMQEGLPGPTVVGRQIVETLNTSRVRELLEGYYRGGPDDLDGVPVPGSNTPGGPRETRPGDEGDVETP